MSDISRVSSEEFYVGTGKGHRLVRNGVSIVPPPPIVPEVPVHRCHGATDSVILSFVDLEYLTTYQAIEINGEVFNEEHIDTLFGAGAVDGEPAAVYTTSTGYTVTFDMSLIDEADPKVRLRIKKHANSTDYVNIRLLPDPSATAEDIYNNIASVEGGGTIVFTGINDVIEFCLKPQYKDPSKYDCDGAYDNIGFFRYNPQLGGVINRYYAVVPTKYNVTIDNIDYGVIEFTERDPDSDGDYLVYKFKPRLKVGEWILSINPQYWGRCYLSLTNGIQSQPIHIKLDPVESELSGDLHIKYDNFWLDVNYLDETVTYNPDTRVIEFCLVDNTTPVQCRGATHDLELTLTQAEPIVDDWDYTNYICNYSVEYNGEVFNADFQENILDSYMVTADGLNLNFGYNYSDEPIGTKTIYAVLNVNYSSSGVGLITPVHVKLTPPPNATKNLITSGDIANNSSIKIDPETGVVAFCLYGEIPS